MSRGQWGNPTTQYHPLAVRITYRLGTSVCMNSFKVRDSSLTTSNPQACADDVAAFCQSSFRNLLTTSDQVLGVDVLDLTTGEGGAVSFSNLTGTMGHSGTGILPSYITAVVSMKGELRRRYGQGRMILPVRFEGHVDQDVLNADGQAMFGGFITAMNARYLGTDASSDYTLINVHGVIPPKGATATSPARPEVPPSWYDVTTLRLNTVTSFLRSRKAGVGS